MALLSLIPLTGFSNLLLISISLIFSLAVAEIALGILHTSREKPTPVTTRFAPDSDIVKRWSDYHTMSELGFLPRPGRYTSKRVNSVGETLYDVVYTIGEDGFRVTPQTHTGQARINFFGGSFMFGEGVQDNETIPHYLHVLDGRVGVKNYGVSGYGVHQALRILDTRDIPGEINVLLTAPWHAERSACVPEFGQGAPKYQLTTDGDVLLVGICPRPKGESLTNRILTHSHLYNQIGKLVQERSQDGQIDLYLALIHQLNTVSRVRGQRLIVGFIKAQDDWFSGSYSNLKILKDLKKSGIDVLDLTLAPTSEQLARQYYIHALDPHPSAKANEARARLIKAHIDKQPALM
jgi:hypothetical protein